jgi:flagellar L-ring protein precursor FlgH
MILRTLICSMAIGSMMALPVTAAKKKDKPAQPPPSALDTYVSQAMSRYATEGSNAGNPGSLWTPTSRLQDVTRDPKATQVDDVVTVLVSESTSAVSTGATKTARTSATQNSITALAGLTKTTGPWANLLNLGGTTTLDGSGTTSRTTTLTTNLTARVTHVLPNGYLVVEGTKLLGINNERQLITVRGVVRPEDINAANSIPSNLLGDLEVQVNGKGVVNDAVKRPNLLYRLLLGLMPF